MALFLAFPSKLIRESFLLVDAKFAKHKCIIRRTFRSRRRPWKEKFSRYFYFFGDL